MSGVLMTPEALVKAATDNQGYETPRLNDQLFLHFKGFRRIENLEPYSELKALWLESNGLLKIENLDHLEKLRCLYLQQNLISTIENLSGLVSLRILDVSQNRIAVLENLSCLPHLQTLNVSKNLLSDADSLQELTRCTALSSVDLSHNSLDGEEVIDVLAQVPNLVSTNMVGNAVANIPQFRKKMISRIRRLGYMDRPVFEGERLAAEAWAVGGREAEIEAREQFRAAQRKKEQDDRRAFREWKQRKVEEHRLRREAQAREAQAHGGDSPPSADAKTTSSSGSAASEGLGGDDPPELQGAVPASSRAEAEAAAQEEAASVAGNGVQRLAHEFWAGEEVRKRIEEEAKNAKKQPNLFGHMEAASFRAPNLPENRPATTVPVPPALPPPANTPSPLEPKEESSQVPAPPTDKAIHQAAPPAAQEENLEPNGEQRPPLVQEQGETCRSKGGKRVASGHEAEHIEPPSAPQVPEHGESPEQPSSSTGEAKEKNGEQEKPVDGMVKGGKNQAQAEEEERRKQVVQESLARYRRDLKRRPKRPDQVTAPPGARSGVADGQQGSVTPDEPARNEAERVIWTEAMDMQLAASLRQSNLDFAAAASAISKHLAAGSKPVGAADCQDRWEELSLGEAMAVLAKIEPTAIARPLPTTTHLEDLEAQAQQHPFQSKYLQKPLPPSSMEDGDPDQQLPPPPIHSSNRPNLPPAAPPPGVEEEETKSQQHSAHGSTFGTLASNYPSSSNPTYTTNVPTTAPPVTDFDLLD